MTHTLVLVEDDHKVAKLLCQFLEHEGFSVIHLDNGEEAIPVILNRQPDLVILDMMLPGIDGVAVCQAIQAGYHKSVLMLTASDSEMNEVIALNAGVDDYLCKPVRPHILLARLNALLRRQQRSQPIAGGTLDLLDLSIDFDKRLVKRGDEVLSVSDADFELLWLLASEAGTVVSREALFKKLRGIEYDGLDRSIDMRVSKLRKLLQSGNPAIQYIQTIRQRGYLFLRETE